MLTCSCIIDDTKRTTLKTMRWFATTPIAARFSIDWIYYIVIARDSKCESPKLSTNRSLSKSSNEPGNSGQFSPESSPEAPPSSLSVEASTISAANPLQSAPTYFPTESSSPMQGQQTTVARYTFNPFRTPQLPRTPRPSSGIIARTPPSSSHK
jgi:hypothetical protein